MARGGRGGRVITVTNLNDSGPGSLRAAVEAKGPRTVVFAVAGNIELASTLAITEPFLTIAGQTAPGGGVCLKNYDCTIAADHVVIRFLRVRPGDVAKKAVDGFSVGESSHYVILDHCSVSWSVDETLSVSGGNVGHVTVQWCLISESLSRSVHHKGPHGYGALVRADGDVSYHHNVFAHHGSRNPRPGTYEDAYKRGIIFDFRNNLVYGWGSRAGYSSGDKTNMNYVGNYLKPNASSKTPNTAFSVGGRQATALYVAGNHLVGAIDANRDNWKMIEKADQAVKLNLPLPVAPVTTDPADDSLVAKLLATVGATLPMRDAVDDRVLRQVREGTGKIIDSQNDVGGWPALAPGRAPTDSDGDGMPDAWETQHGLDPKNASDGSAIVASTGYTNLEHYLNRLVAMPGAKP
jgi:pectate lyase